MRALYQNKNVMLVGVKIPIEQFEKLLAIHAFHQDLSDEMKAPTMLMNSVIAMVLDQGIQYHERTSLGLQDIVAWSQACKFAEETMSDPFATNGIWEVK